MHLVRIGYRTINLEYLIETRDSKLGAPPEEVSPGQIRVSVYPGSVFDVGGDAAVQLRLRLDDSLRILPSKGPNGDGPQKRPRTGRVKTLASSSPKTASPRDE